MDFFFLLWIIALGLISWDLPERSQHPLGEQTLSSVELEELNEVQWTAHRRHYDRCQNREQRIWNKNTNISMTCLQTFITIFLPMKS